MATATYAHRNPAHAQLRRTPALDTQYNQPFRPPQPPLPPQHRATGAPQPPPKDGAVPPLPRQNSKTVPPSPPRVINDAVKSLTYTRIGFLGEGGFARVYEVADVKGQRHAIKVVTKSSLKTKKSKTKLYAEIKLHKSLAHPNIVYFEDCFEDTDNVYMTLELCPNGSMMDMLRHRKRFTEPEARYYLVQVVGACQYMHTNQVIHRDLKLGNLFLDAKMNIKVGDFGLAALIESPGERKKTICGTPNYIAPEVLFDTANGHSFEVDTWSIGVILYTLVVGKPPFQTKDVKAIYQRIRDNNYEFPSDREMSKEVQELIVSILTHNPLERPTLFEIVDHPWITQGLMPDHIPKSALEHPPSFPDIDRRTSQRNLARLRRHTLLDEDALNLSTLSNSVASMGVQPKNYAQVMVQQEREFQKAVQPASPISDLLKSAKQPLVVANGPLPPSPHRAASLYKKLASSSGSQSVPLAESNNADPRKPLTAVAEEDEEDEAALAKAERNRTRELESQKARIVAQMVPDSQGAGKAQDGELGSDEGRENMPPPPVPQRSRDRMIRPDDKEKRMNARSLAPPSRSLSRAPSPSTIASEASTTTVRSTLRPSGSATSTVSDTVTINNEATTSVVPTRPLHGFDQLAELLTFAFDMKDQGKVFKDPAEDANLEHDKVFLISWVDYCNKYGMGYALSDGTVGVHFNDSTTLLLAPNKVNIDYLSSRRSGTVFVRKHYLAEDHPDDVHHKYYLLKHFEEYMFQRLNGGQDFCFEDLGRTKNLDFVQKYFRMKNVIVFRLSHEVIQFNFFDHTKVILSNGGHAVMYIDKHYRITQAGLAAIMYRALKPSKDPAQRKADDKLVAKIKYCKEVMVSIRAAGMSDS